MSTALKPSNQNVEVIDNRLLLAAPEIHKELLQCRTMLVALAFAISQKNLTDQQRSTIIHDIQARLGAGSVILAQLG